VTPSAASQLASHCQPHTGYNRYSALEKPDAVLSLARRNLRHCIDRRPAPATYLWWECRALLEENSIDRIVAVMTVKTFSGVYKRDFSLQD
jgi:hypothetical protein